MQVKVKAKDNNRKTPMWKKQRLTLTHLMKEKRNLQDERDLKNSFQNTSEELPSTALLRCSAILVTNR